MNTFVRHARLHRTHNSCGVRDYALTEDLVSMMCYCIFLLAVANRGSVLDSSIVIIVFSSTVIDHVMEHVVHSLIVEETQLY